MNENIASSLQKEIDAVISELSSGIAAICKENLVGVYLFGSLTYGDFNENSSDIDLVVILDVPANQEDISLLRKLHAQIEENYPRWASRIECSYTPQIMLKSILPPGTRPYYGEKVFYPEADYGNEWIINLYLLYNYGRTILGLDFKELIEPVAIAEVQKACVNDLFTEWEPKLKDPAWLDNPHYQSYLVLNLCRILNTVLNATTLSKKKSAAWVKEKYPEWAELIKESEIWRYGLEMNEQEKTLGFLKFVIEQVHLSPYVISTKNSY